MAKRIFDIVISVAMLALAYPVMIAIAMAVRNESPGPAVFRQRRAGLNGRPFVMLKFRSMRTDSDPYGRSPTSGDDPRLTRVGKWLRESSLDELPQLFNVLDGTMSLVGPRPLYERQAMLWNDRQRGRLLVRPGITGWAQISGRGEVPLEEKIELDLWYVANRSLRLDVKILFATAMGAVGGGEIYESKYSLRDQQERI